MTHSHPRMSGVAPAGADTPPSAPAATRDPEEPFWLGIAVFGGLLFTVGLLLGGAL